jgi:signal transduction histidine kinase/ligand-binding sensor domain-containing protein
MAAVPSSVGVPPAAGGNSVLNWEINDRLPVNKIRSIVQTRDGYLWLGTADGLDRYDGIHLKSYNKTSISDLPSNLISCLYEDRFGGLWIGCENGELAYLVAGRFGNVSLPKAWTSTAVEQIVEDRNGRLWVMNRRGEILPIQNHQAGRMRPSAWQNNDHDAGPTTRVLVRDAEGVVWLSEHATLWELTPEEKTGAKMELPTASPNPVVFAARAGGFWVIDGDQLRRLVNGRWVADLGRHDAKGVESRLSMELTSGHILMSAGGNELAIISPDGAERRITVQDSPANDSILCLQADREGNIWIGTAASGLKVIRPRVVTMVEPPDRWLGRAVVSVVSDQAGELFIGTQKASIYRYARGIFTGMSQLQEQAASPVQAVCVDPDNALWIGTLSDGLWRETQDVAERVGIEAVSGGRINALFRSREGILWLGTDKGPVQIQNGKMTPVAREFSEARGDIRCFAEGTDGSIWMGTQEHGLGRLLDGRWTQFRRQDGLPGETVWSLFADNDDSIWIGTYGSGICRYKDGQFSAIGSKNGLPSDVICSIVDDQKGCLWMSSFAGIIRVTKDALRRCADGEDPQVSCQVFGFAEGLPTMEFAGGNQPSACRTSDGRLWFACNKGLAMVDPDAARYSALSPLVALEDMLVDGESVDLGVGVAQKIHPGEATYEVEPGRHHIEIRYAGLSFNSPERVQFRYRMKGLEKGWVKAGDRRSVTFSFLPAGEYVFEVSACNNGGAWSEPAAPLKLIVPPYFWQTWWFLGSTTLAGMAGVALAATGISRKRERRKREEMERQRAREVERTRIARDIHDQLGVGLTRISMLSLMAASRAANPVSVQDHSAEIHKTTAELTRSMDEIVWAVNPRHDTLDSLLTYLGEFARTFLESAEMRCRLDLPLDVPSIHLSPEARHHVFLAFQESLNNAVRHGAATEVRVTAKLQPTELILSLEDNGRGFDYAQSRQRESAGNGLKNMEARLLEIGGQFACESSAGAGTKIRLIIPILQ